MPLNSTTYLESHGWEGKGVPLDGKQGRGLKKPLALPMKRNQRGLGKDRDRATEWWDSLFEASAKTLNIKVAAAGGSSGDKESKGTTLPPASSSSTAVKIQLDDDKKAKSTLRQSKVSLVSQAKRDYARKMLMSGFVKGREVRKSAAEEELEAKLREEEGRRRMDKSAAISEAAVDNAKEKKGKQEKKKGLDDAKSESESSESKAERNEEKRRRKMEKAARKQEKAIKRSEKEEKRKAKEVLREEKERKKEKKEKAKRNVMVASPADSSEDPKSKSKKRKREEAQ